MPTTRRTLISCSLLTGAALTLAAASAARSPSSAAPDTGDRMAAAGKSYVSALDAAGRSRGTWDLGAEARYDWHFIPRSREGMPLKDMTVPQREAAHRLLQSVLSAQGYLKATGVSQLEAILGAIEGRPGRRDPEDYYFSIFGTPTDTEPWAWRYEGHHISLNVTAAPGSAPSMTPVFIGSNPHIVREGPFTGLSLLGTEETLGRQLLSMLDDTQAATATIAVEAPSDIVTGNARRVELDEYEGLAASDMSQAQRDALMQLVGEYLHNADPEIARAEMTRIHDAGVENLHFAWAGSAEPGEGHYYRIHGPTLLIEYDNVQGGANHVHSVWRDPENDFGEDLLRRHYEEADHHQQDHDR